MAERYYQEGQKPEGGFWRFLAIGIGAFVVLALVIDAINIDIKNLSAASG